MTHTRTYVLDTSVLLSDPRAYAKFAEHEVVIPLVVVKELEGKRNDPVLGYPAREALRGLADLISTDEGAGAVVNDSGGIARIEINHVNQAGLPDALANDHTHDTRILAVAKNLAADRARVETEARPVVVVSKDLPMRILAHTLGLAAQEYRNEMVVVDHPYTGVETFDVGTALVNDLYQAKTVDFAALTSQHLPSTGDDLEADGPDPRERLASLPANTGLRLNGPTSSALAVTTPDKTIALIDSAAEAFGVKGRSPEQRIALHHLLNPEREVVSLGGPAGTGKTFLALAAGLEQTLEQRRYSKVIVFRPLFAVGGQDLGFLPGTAEEKMSPWGAAVFDALSAMTSKEVVEELLHREMLEVLPLTHIRGRTLSNAFVIVDEAQSLERPVLLAALTRLGEGSKIVLSHDVQQRDNLRVGRYDGIAAVVERLKGEPLFAHTALHRTERGGVAEMATRLLGDLT